MQIHVVQRGETLWRISQRYGAEINQIAWANLMENPDVLVTGEALVIPEPYREYIVMPGDQLWQIAQAYGITVEALAEYNQIENPSLIFPGQMIRLPYFYHTVQPGETLWLIAERYGVTIEAIAAANQIADPSLIIAGQMLRIPADERPSIEVNAYTTRFDEAGSFEVLTLGRHFTYLSPFTYSFREDGSLTEMDDAGLLAAARANGVAPLMVVANYTEDGFDSDLAASLLRNPEVQETLITNALNVIRSKGYAGINFDFEYVYPEDRDNYTAFLQRVVARFRPEGLLVSTALAPKISGEQTGLLYEAHDYGAHGAVVDFIVLMTYEWGWAGGPPWAIAPIDQVRRVLDYAVTVIPRNKIMMGFPLYGRDWRIPWVQGTFARSVSPLEAVRLAARYGADIQYDETYQSPFFRYTDETGQQHEVWFEDARSAQSKFDTVKAYGLRGVSYWVLGSPFPQVWHVQQNNFRVTKR